MTFEERDEMLRELGPIDPNDEVDCVYLDWKAEREKLIGALEWAIEYIGAKEHYYFLNIHASDKEALKQARAILAEVKGNL